jgi:hypothetical protein
MVPSDDSASMSIELSMVFGADQVAPVVLHLVLLGFQVLGGRRATRVLGYATLVFATYDNML